MRCSRLARVGHQAALLQRSHALTLLILQAGEGTEQGGGRRRGGRARGPGRAARQGGHHNAGGLARAGGAPAREGLARALQGVLDQRDILTTTCVCM